jgi:hypothetical protein
MPTQRVLNCWLKVKMLYYNIKMDIIDENKYNEFKNILFGCRNLNDATYFADLYIKKNPETKKLVMSLLKGKKYYSSCKDFCLMQKIMEKCNECVYQKDVMDIIEGYFSEKENSVQYRTLMRIAKSKKILGETESQNKITFHKKGKIVTITKPCPHCSRSYIGGIDTMHVICGYNDSNRGYDWEGCQKDWCFSCGKMLSKSWEENKLFVEPNRIHNPDCCKKHAHDNKRSYTTEYCQCEHKYVMRMR